MSTTARPASGRPARRAVLARWLLALAWLLLAATGASAAATLPRDALTVARSDDADNAILSGCAGWQPVFFLDIDAAPTNAGGTLSCDVMTDLPHPNEKGYEIWATRMEPTLLQLLAQP
jgi:lysophospholipase L1-like esterase